MRGTDTVHNHIQHLGRKRETPVGQLVVLHEDRFHPFYAMVLDDHNSFSTFFVASFLIFAYNNIIVVGEHLQFIR